MRAPTSRQLDILRFIHEFSKKNGTPPTMRETGDHFGVKSSTIFLHMDALEKKGCLIRSNKARSVKLTVKALEIIQPGRTDFMLAEDDDVTPRQCDVLEFIQNFFDENRLSPSIQEVADHFGFRPSTAFTHIEKLIKKGYLARLENKARTIQPTSKSRNFLQRTRYYVVSSVLPEKSLFCVGKYSLSASPAFDRISLH